MALTYTAIYSQRFRGGRKQTRTKITLDNSYPTGGYALLYGPVGSGLGMDVQIDAFHVHPTSDNPYIPREDRANKKVKWGVIGSGGTWVELANTAYVLDALTAEVWAEGS